MATPKLSAAETFRRVSEILDQIRAGRRITRVRTVSDTPGHTQIWVESLLDGKLVRD